MSCDEVSKKTETVATSKPKFFCLPARYPIGFKLGTDRYLNRHRE
jgi:hypothetical protein